MYEHMCLHQHTTTGAYIGQDGRGHARGWGGVRGAMLMCQGCLSRYSLPSAGTRYQFTVWRSKESIRYGEISYRKGP